MKKNYTHGSGYIKGLTYIKGTSLIVSATSNNNIDKKIKIYKAIDDDEIWNGACGD